MSPLTLAFIGDAVYELLVRERIVGDGSMPVGRLHSMAVGKVCCTFQAKAYELLSERLTEEEYAVMKRGRNANGAKVPKNSSPADYRRATGVETLFGYLYMMGRLERINELFELIVQNIPELL
nr:ribonuclease III domain-containing protein [Candidatus Soleaferrea massiliensis]